MGLISGARGLLLKQVFAFIDAQVTKRLEPFLAMAEVELPSGDRVRYSDFVVDDQGDMSIENMVVDIAVANEALQKEGLPFRVSTFSARRIAIDIPWEDLFTGSAAGAWRLDVDGLMVVMRPLERERWCLASLRKAKEASVEAALAALIKRLKAADETGGKKGGWFESIKQRLFSSVNLTVRIKDVHLRLERAASQGDGLPAFSLGFVVCVEARSFQRPRPSSFTSGARSRPYLRRELALARSCHRAPSRPPSRARASRRAPSSAKAVQGRVWCVRPRVHPSLT